MRMEVTFSSGKFVAFPEVKQETLVNKGEGEAASVSFEFKGGHNAIVCLSKVDFIELMED